MAYLLLSRQGASLLRFPIAQERILVGRDLDCDIPLDDPDISRHHFEITWDGRSYQLTDFSSNGTFVNGRRVSGTADLAFGDQIEIGGYSLTFSENAPAVTDVTVRRNAQPTLVLKYEPKDKLITIEQIALKITPPNGATVERTFDSLPITFGAGAQNHVQIDDDPYISRQHCQIEASTQGIALRDLSSRNGTWWQRQQIGSQILPDRGQFLLGKTTVDYRIAVVREPLAPTAQQRFGEMLGASKAMQELFALIVRVAPSNATVLITGESGTGKELLARALHAGSGRAQRPFVAINCGAIPATIIESELFGHERGAFTGAITQHKGVFEQASGGTLFLDEIGEMPLELQSRLLRVLETKTVRRVGGTQEIAVDLRIAAATHRDLPALVAQGAFREDLYYRLYMVPMELPALRERPEDIPLLAQHFLTHLQPHGTLCMFAEDALQWMRHYPWPGNIRELKHCVERGLLTAANHVITAADMTPAPSRKTPPPASTLTVATPTTSDNIPVSGANQLRAQERQLIEQALHEAAGNIAKAAKKLGLPRTTLNARIRSLDVDIEQLRNR